MKRDPRLWAHQLLIPPRENLLQKQQRPHISWPLLYLVGVKIISQPLKDHAGLCRWKISSFFLIKNKHFRSCFKISNDLHVKGEHHLKQKHTASHHVGNVTTSYFRNKESAFPFLCSYSLQKLNSLHYYSQKTQQGKNSKSLVNPQHTLACHS